MYTFYCPFYDKVLYLDRLVIKSAKLQDARIQLNRKRDFHKNCSETKWAAVIQRGNILKAKEKLEASHMGGFGFQFQLFPGLKSHIK